VGHVDHRAVDLLDAGGRGLHRADAVVVGRHVGVEAAGRPQRDREDRPEPVDRVEREQDRDVQPRVLDGLVLEVVDLVGIGEAEDAADRLLRLGVVDLPVAQERELVELLLQRHLLQQGVDLPLDALARRASCLAKGALVA
jgi:hypothetical protein